MDIEHIFILKEVLYVTKKKMKIIAIKIGKRKSV